MQANFVGSDDVKRMRPPSSGSYGQPGGGFPSGPSPDGSYQYSPGGPNSYMDQSSMSQSPYGQQMQQMPSMGLQLGSGGGANNFRTGPHFRPSSSNGYPLGPFQQSGPQFPPGNMNMGNVSGVGAGGVSASGLPPGSLMGGFAGANVSSIPNNRTVYLGGLPPNTSYEDVLNHVKFGPVEQVKIIEDKNCAFISFIESSAALNFYADSQAKHIQIGGMEVKVGWGKASPCPAKILAAVQSGATRNVFIGNIDETFNETGLATEFAQFGPVDQVRVLAEKRIAFVHMASVAAAMKAVSSLPTEPRYAGRRVNYGKDRCGSFTPGHGPLSPMPGPGVYGSGPFGDGFYPQSPMSGNRTVYLGGVHAEAVTKDICDVVRGGILQNVKYMPEKNIAFVKFIDPGAALAFYNRGNNEGVVIKGKRVKVGWGKPSGLPLSIAAVVQSGASRNVYIGQIDSTITEERLKRDLAEYGEIEMVNIVPDKNIAFANFTDILAAVRAVEMLRGRADYAGFKISYGKDRCGNPLRPPVPRDPNVVSGGAPPVSSAGNGAYSPTASPETAVPPPTL